MLPRLRSMSESVRVPDQVRLRLAHGVLEHLAGSVGAPVLHVKGVALHPGLAAGRGRSTDCDLLVAPDAVDRLVRALERAGWEPVTSFAAGSVFGHAAALHHPLWGTVDLHRAFPGLDEDPRATFARFWAGREQVALGGRSCPVPDLDAQRLLLLVHAARDAGGHGRHDVRVAWEDVDEAARSRVDALAAELGGVVPLAIATGRPERAAGRPGVHLWTALHEHADATTVWRARLRDASGPRERLRLLTEALRINPDHLALRLGHPPSPAERRREWWARWGRALRAVLRRR